MHVLGGSGNNCVRLAYYGAAMRIRPPPAPDGIELTASIALLRSNDVCCSHRAIPSTTAVQLYQGPKGRALFYYAVCRRPQTDRCTIVPTAHVFVLDFCLPLLYAT